MDVPVMEPTRVPTASATRACFIWGILPSLSSIPARLAVPTRVPMVSNISIMQKVMMSITAVPQPIWKKSAKSNFIKVVFIISAKGGTKEASFREAKGAKPSRKMKPPTQ